MKLKDRVSETHVQENEKTLEPVECEGEPRRKYDDHVTKNEDL